MIEISCCDSVAISTLPGSTLDELANRNWPTLTVQPLTVDERTLLLRDYLGQYAKRLSSNHVQHITKCPQSTNPLYLRALLDVVIDPDVSYGMMGGRSREQRQY